MPTPGEVLIDVRDGVATLRLANPQRRNAIDSGMWRALTEFAERAGGDRQVRAVVLRGDGDLAFSGGADISEFDGQRSGATDAKVYDDLVEHACQRFEGIPKPTIALLHGPCVGAGVSLAASCDLIVAAADAFFAVPAARLGLGYDPRGIERFLRVFGLPATRALLYTAARLPAARAHAVGAVHSLAPAAEVDAAAADLVRRIAGNAPLTLRAGKTALRALTVRRDAALLEQAHTQAEAADLSADYLEGRRAFAEKRAPSFSGQ